MDTEKLLTVQEAASEIGVSQSAIRNATLQGRLPFVAKFGRKLIERDALAAYQRRTQPGGIKAKGRPYAANGAESSKGKGESPEKAGEGAGTRLG